jgi:hypothetical protein
MGGHPRSRRTFYFGGTGGGVFRTTMTGRELAQRSPMARSRSARSAPSRSRRRTPTSSTSAPGSAAVRSNVSIGKGMYKSTRRRPDLELRRPGERRRDRATWSCTRRMRTSPGSPRSATRSATIRSVASSARGTAVGHWDKVLFVSDSTGASDIAMNPDNPDELYAGMWRASASRGRSSAARAPRAASTRRRTAARLDEAGGRPAAGVDGQDQRRRRAVDSDACLRTDRGRRRHAGPAGGVHGGVYRSDDAAPPGRASATDGLINRPFYYTYIDVDPTNADVVYVNNELVFKSDRRWAHVRASLDAARRQPRHVDQPERPGHLHPGQ